MLDYKGRVAGRDFLPDGGGAGFFLRSWWFIGVAPALGKVVGSSDFLQPLWGRAFDG
jgi:hypothetical protein